MPLPYICCVTSQQITGVLKRETLWSLASGCWADSQGGPAGNLRVLTAVYCPQAQVREGSTPRAPVRGRRAVQGGAGRCMKSQRATCSRLAAAEISSLLHAEINKQHTSHVEGSPAPSSADYSCHCCFIIFVVSLLLEE